MKLLVTILFAIMILSSCKKEHLGEEINSEPLSYFRAVIDSNTDYYAAGVDNYVGVPSTFDTLVRRTFKYSIKNFASAHDQIEISLNNYEDTLDNLQNDFNQTIQTGDYNYNYLTGGLTTFRPLHVTIKWINGNGRQYSSTYYATGPQSPSTFHISTVEDIIKDGLLYKKATVSFSCKLYDALNSDTAYINSGTAVLLFGGI